MKMTRREFALVHCSAVLGLASVAGAGSGLAGAATTASASGTGKTILVVGDSLSAEYGLQRGQGWVALLAQRLQQQKPAWQAQNASISGDTTSGGRTRLPALLAQYKPAIVIIELGANDALRGLPLASSKDNLAAMASTAKAAGAKVLLIGMQMPPNYGAAYERDFEAVFTQVSQAGKTALLPFLLKGVADRPEGMDAWFQADRIHPLAKAHPILLDNVWAVLKPML